MAKNNAGLVKEMIDNTTNFEDELELLDDASLDSSNFLNDDLKTHLKIKSTLVGNLVAMAKNTSKVVLQTTHEMSVDEFGLIHSGFLFGSAEYAAVAAVNEPNVVIIGCRSKFFAPAKVGDLITFEARGRFEDARKREIKVIGMINEIKVFEGLFQAVLLERHILQTKIDELQASFNPKDLA
ncbi:MULTISPECIES: thioesterase [unclassified Sulfurospirillum]|uniref:PaaI family thioesterase n=1 Tax=unclassified Sulfurospirillum TaxID=2618290 RepID=UPI000691FA9F|nr:MULTISPECIES: thioesterase [unclassified Sulfurospirillum]